MKIDFERLPGEVLITDVTLRDGLQQERNVLETRDKIALVGDMIKAGVKSLEVTSFVRPDLVPQLADAAELFRALPAGSECNFRALVPNLRGYDRARKAGCKNIVLFVSATEEHNRNNLGKSIDETLDILGQVLSRATKDGVNTDVAVSMAFEQYPVKLRHVLEFLVDKGQKTVILCDTSGMANPKLVRERLQLAKRYFDREEVTLHFHDTTGCAIANVLVSLLEGFSSFDAAIGGLGGCPFAEGAAGNIALEDLVWFLSSLNVKTGIDIGKVVEINGKLSELLKRPLYDSKVARYFRGRKSVCGR